mmetsp:Transcript_12027/g.30275  ORF Transcript_12027/g.30275 Transcript_12027/m.30275 type:complete len:244 (-) Transcript_12027:254-985(-)
MGVPEGVASDSLSVEEAPSSSAEARIAWLLLASSLTRASSAAVGGTGTPSQLVGSCAVCLQCRLSVACERSCNPQLQTNMRMHALKCIVRSSRTANDFLLQREQKKRFSPIKWRRKKCFFAWYLVAKTRGQTWHFTGSSQRCVPPGDMCEYSSDTGVRPVVRYCGMLCIGGPVVRYCGMLCIAGPTACALACMKCGYIANWPTPICGIAGMSICGVGSGPNTPVTPCSCGPVKKRGANACVAV